VTESTHTLAKLLGDATATAGTLAAYLDRLSLAEAVGAVRSVSGRKAHAALWRLGAANQAVSVADLVPRNHPPMQPVTFHGKNSLPAFSWFEKICCRPPAATRDDVLWGYNETKIRPLIGPGYYVVTNTTGNPLGGVAFDYRSVPRDHPPGWPPIRANSVGLSRFIYNNTVDYMRRLAANVFIGCATRDGRELGSYFILVRELL
jgi:hypothetical protein